MGYNPDIFLGPELGIEADPEYRELRAAIILARAGIRTYLRAGGERVAVIGPAEEPDYSRPAPGPEDGTRNEPLSRRIRRILRT